MGGGERVAAVAEAVGDEEDDLPARLERGAVEEVLGREERAEGVGSAAGVDDVGDDGVEELAFVGVFVRGGVVAEDDDADLKMRWV